MSAHDAVAAYLHERGTTVLDSSNEELLEAIHAAQRTRLILTMGLPRSGKSTWALKQGYPIVCGDALRLALHGQRWCPDAAPMVWTMARYMVKALFLAGHTTVIVDATNLLERLRRSWLSDDWDIYVHHEPTNADVCKARAIASGQEDLLPVIDRMVDYFEPLNIGWKTI